MKKTSKVVKYNKWGYIFLIPFIVIYLVFQMIPLVTTIYNSFFENWIVFKKLVFLQLVYKKQVHGSSKKT